ncbi:MAG: hypothetical protein ACUVWN_08250 [bacterium]
MNKEIKQADYARVVIQNYLIALENNMKAINKSLYELKCVLQKAQERVMQLEDRKEKLEIQE